ncbi:hypothetical protein KTS45_00865 [Halomicroarcula limicola]|uniref:Uncharacterized protein n=1 Tax=Haloarcula limicola TaxID=1429915 RepID=A0A8J7Y114_9EURY|nr:hypothetical protein [Halomicroarcula limicola]MBV0922740.1 hypothetical protein [Halomicroarcula limicola]
MSGFATAVTESQKAPDALQSRDSLRAHCVRVLASSGFPERVGPFQSTRVG